MAIKPMGPELATGAGAAAARRGRTKARKEAKNCILTRVIQNSLKGDAKVSRSVSGLEVTQEQR